MEERIIKLKYKHQEEDMTFIYNLNLYLVYSFIYKINIFSGRTYNCKIIIKKISGRTYNEKSKLNIISGRTYNKSIN